MNTNEPKTLHYRVEAMQKSEVYQWIEAESPEEALRIAKAGDQYGWEQEGCLDNLEVYDLEVTEEEEA